MIKRRHNRKQTHLSAILFLNPAPLHLAVPYPPAIQAFLWNFFILQVFMDFLDFYQETYPGIDDANFKGVL